MLATTFKSITILLLILLLERASQFKWVAEGKCWDNQKTDEVNTVNPQIAPQIALQRAPLNKLPLQSYKLLTSPLEYLRPISAV